MQRRNAVILRTLQVAIGALGGQPKDPRRSAEPAGPAAEVVKQPAAAAAPMAKQPHRLQKNGYYRLDNLPVACRRITHALLERL